MINKLDVKGYKFLCVGGKFLIYKILLHNRIIGNGFCTQKSLKTC